MDDQHEPDQQARGGGGRFLRTTETAERDARAAELRTKGWSYRKIAAELDIDVATAHRAVQRALRAIVEEPAAEVRQLELERLDTLYAAAMDVLEREHVHVSGGTVVRVRVLDDSGDPIVVGHEDDGKPIYKERDLIDDGPTLKAIDTALKVQARRAALLGLDSPVKADVGGTVKYEIVGVPEEDL